MMLRYKKTHKKDEHNSLHKQKLSCPLLIHNSHHHQSTKMILYFFAKYKIEQLYKCGMKTNDAKKVNIIPEESLTPKELQQPC